MSDTDTAAGTADDLGRRSIGLASPDPDDIDSVAAEIAGYLRRGEGAAVKAFLVVQELPDIARLIEHMAPADGLAALRQLPLRDRADLLGDLRTATQVALTEEMERGELARVMAEMSHDERVDLYKALEPEAQAAVLPGLAQAERDDLRRLAAWPEETAGAIMTSDYATLLPTMTAPEGLDALRRQAVDSETVYTAYVVDSGHHLLGVVSLRDILVARTRQTVGEIMRTDPVTVAVEADQEDCAALIQHYDLNALPVLDAEGRLVGIVTQDDAMDVVSEEATEDMLKGSTVEPIPGSLRDAGIVTLYRARIFWLVLLVFGNIFSGAGIAHFEDTIAAHLSLLFFLPLLIASGGNAGAQSATLMVRALATGDVARSEWGVMFLRELTIGLALGLTMAAAVSLIGVARAGPEVALVVSISMLMIVLTGVAVGVSLPFVLTRFGFDPATASGPLVTSIADVLGVLIYFSVAGAILALD